MEVNRVMIGMILGGIIASGCTTYTTLQTPETLQPGAVNIGVGTALPFDKDKVLFIQEVSARVGLFSGFDAGFKYSLGGLIFVDGKMSLMESPVRVAADLGWSFYRVENTTKTTNISTVGFYPALYLGGENWYTGIRFTHISTSGQFTFFSTTTVNGSSWVSANVVLGGVVGEKVRLLPEINVYAPFKGTVFLVPAVGLQFVL